MRAPNQNSKLLYQVSEEKGMLNIESPIEAKLMCYLAFRNTKKYFLDMETFNANNFIKSLKEGYEMIPVIENDQAAKVMVSDAIKAHKFNPVDVLSYICDKMGNPSVKLTNEEWKTIVKNAIKQGDLIGKCLDVCARTRKGKKVSIEGLFYKVVSTCGGDPNYLIRELYLNKVGWKRVTDSLVKIELEEETKTEEMVVTKKTSIKTSKKDPRCKSIVGFKDGVRKEWNSYRECEMDLYGDPKKGHGVVSQVINGKGKTVKGWTIYRKGEEPAGEEVKATVKSHRHPRTKTIRQYGVDKDGHKVDRIWNSITEASKATGISHSGISKTISGTYQTAGGYRWEMTTVAAA